MTWQNTEYAPAAAARETREKAAKIIFFMFINAWTAGKCIVTNVKRGAVCAADPKEEWKPGKSMPNKPGF